MHDDNNYSGYYSDDDGIIVWKESGVFEVNYNKI